ncbi:hypothetical protein FRC00_007311 [Tulasnella sp. 408]|nr:hypothetical protein FRC00_007311 [Tulasnella sp. 408]
MWNRESGIVPGVGVAVGPTMGEQERVGGYPDRGGWRAAEGMQWQRQFESLEENEREGYHDDPHTHDLRPLGWWPGPAELSAPDRHQGLHVPDNVFVMNINETSFLYYLYTGFISFSPLTSSFQFPD